MSAKHTPGPWEVGPVSTDRVGIMADDVIVATLYAPHADHVGRADARLIAAAPDLLEALIATSAVLAALGQTMGGAYEQACAAIGKATGVQP